MINLVTIRSRKRIICTITNSKDYSYLVDNIGNIGNIKFYHLYPVFFESTVYLIKSGTRYNSHKKN